MSRKFENYFTFRETTTTNPFAKQYRFFLATTAEPSKKLRIVTTLSFFAFYRL